MTVVRQDWAGRVANQAGVSMTELDDVLDSLNSMSLLQLLMAFVACIAYTLAQSGLVASRARRLASVSALVAASGFVVLSGTWAYSVVLVAVAVAGIGAFVASAWLLGRVFRPAPAPVVPTGEALASPEPDPAAAGVPSSARPRRRAAATSR